MVGALAALPMAALPTMESLERGDRVPMPTLPAKELLPDPVWVINPEERVRLPKVRVKLFPEAMVVSPLRETAPVPVLKVLAPVWEKPAATVTVPLAVKPEVAVIKPEMVGVAVQLVPLTVKLPPREVKLLPVTVRVPLTSSLAPGAVVPTPTLPLSRRANLSTPAESLVSSEKVEPVPNPWMVTLELGLTLVVPIPTLPRVVSVSLAVVGTKVLMALSLFQ